jgi:NAD/NADP transhydrogenase beta subunit
MPGERTGGSQQLVNQQLLKILSAWLDNVFVVPGTRLRFGLDPIIGLIPVVGDLTTTVISLYIIACAAQMQVPKSTLARMGLNIVIDSVVGAIPFVGNIFDFAWKSNALNMQLLERHASATPTERKKHNLWDWLFAAGMMLVVVVVVIGSLTSTAWLIAWLFSLVRGS